MLMIMGPRWQRVSTARLAGNRSSDIVSDVPSRSDYIRNSVPCGQPSDEDPMWIYDRSSPSPR